MTKQNKFKRISILVILIVIVIFIGNNLLNRKESENYIDNVFQPIGKNGGFDKNKRTMLNKLKKLHKTDKYFYEQLSVYLSLNDSLDTSHNDTIKFSAENECYFHTVTPFEITKSGLYVISRYYPTKFIALFSHSGKLLNKFGKEGRGPGEYIEPSFCSVKNDTLYCFDNKLNKIIVYQISSGRHVNDYLIKDGEIFPKDFSVSPIKNIFIFYRIFLFNNPSIISIYNLKNNSLNHIGDFGKMGNVNRISRSFQILGMDVSEYGYIFTLQPQQLGFTVFTPEGNEITSFYHTESNFFKELKVLNKDILKNPRKETDTFFEHSFCNFIHYLGNGILGINVVSPSTRKKRSKLSTIYTFWTVDGFYLGSLKYKPGFIIHGQNGKLYRWIENSEKSRNGVYNNPSLIITKLW